MRKKAIVIGAGISGLSAALALRRTDWDVEVYEQSEALRDGGAGLSLWPNAMAALERLGLLEAVRRKGRAVHDSAILTASGSPLISMNAAEPNQVFSMLGIKRSELFGVLAEAAGNIPIHLDHRFEERRGTEGKIEVIFGNGARVEADLLVGADGIHSNVRTCIAGHWPVKRTEQGAWRGIASIDHVYCRNGYAFEAWGPEGRFGFLPLSDEKAYWFAMIRGSSENRPDRGKMELLRAFSSYAEPVPTVLYQTEERDILYNAMQDIEPLRQWCTESMVLVGDAAHAALPNLGQGACLALEDAVVLADSLKGSRSIGEGLRQYEARRMRRARMIMQRSRMFGQLSLPNLPCIYLARNLLVRALPARLQDMWMKQVTSFVP